MTYVPNKRITYVLTEFLKISSTENANEAWTILQNTYEVTKAMKYSKLQRLTTSFEEIRMEDAEVLYELYAKLKDIVNFAFNLGKKIPEPKIVRKILISLLLRSPPLKNQRTLTLFL